MENIAHKLQADYPQFVFVTGAAACWSPREKQVTYVANSPHGLAGLFHELAHAMLAHTDYQSDLDLLQKEIDAWEKAIFIAKNYTVTIDPGHVQDCLDTYRDWLHKRSTCPHCSLNGLQNSIQTYKCLNCGNAWHVSGSRFCRPYRRSAPTKKDQDNVPVFARFT